MTIEDKANRNYGSIERLEGAGSSVVDQHHINNNADEDNETTTTLMAGWNVTNIIQGIGIMGLPYACVSCGWYSIPIIILVAIYCCYTGELIAKCLYVDALMEDIRPPFTRRKTFACIAADVWPRFGRTYASAIVLLEVFGAMILYTILLGHSLQHISNKIFNLNLGTGYWTVIYGYATFPFLMVPNMRVITYFSSIALFGLVTSIFTTIIFCILETANSAAGASGLPPVQLLRMPVGLSIILFSYCVHGVLPNIERSMKHPQSYNKMMRYSFSIAVVMKIVFGLLPAYLFGSHVKQVITDNMMIRKDFALAANIGISVNVFFSIPLVCYIVSELLNVAFFKVLNPNQFDVKTGGVKCESITWLFLTRMIVLSASIFIAISVPQFANIMSLIGSVTGSNLCFILPALFHLKLFKSSLSLRTVIFHWFTVAFGVVVMILGVVLSSYELYKNF